MRNGRIACKFRRYVESGIDNADERESGRPIRSSSANRPQTYGTDRNLSKQNGVLICISNEQHHAAGARGARKQKEKTRALLCSLENQRVVTGVTPTVNTRVQIARLARVAAPITSRVRASN